MERKEVKEAREVKEVKENNGRVAAFFDLDGTLLPFPSLEKRFFRILRFRREIPLTNYFLWFGEALRLLPQGICAVRLTNKMYLRSVHIFDGNGGSTSLGKTGAGTLAECSAQTSGRPSSLRASQVGGQASATPPMRRNPRCPVPLFFEGAVERLAWHARQGHALVLVSGTLEPLAQAAARRLKEVFAADGVVATILVRATKLEEINGQWTGRILGEAMFGESKAHAVKQLAQDAGLDLSQCYAYGDSGIDKAMLASVGNPFAVNPSRSLARVAKARRWRTLQWNKGKGSAKILQTGFARRGLSRRALNGGELPQAGHCP